jgi:hypothetical protein
MNGKLTVEEVNADVFLYKTKKFRLDSQKSIIRNTDLNSFFKVDNEEHSSLKTTD